MVKQVLAHWQLPAALSDEIRIDCRSTIPVAKGMASSTADIAATAVATSRHLGFTLDDVTLSALRRAGTHRQHCFSFVDVI
jgi:L-threonine kinase